MRIHYLQHVAFEDLANIEIWARKRGHAISVTRLYMNEIVPEMNRFDCLVVMGGPMNIYEEEAYPWLIAEKKFIREAINSGKVVLGVCLGAQLIADILGAKVIKNNYKEIGWYPVRKTPEASDSLFLSLPEEFMTFHWHGDTFDIPPGAKRLAESQGCKNQAFEYNGKVFGLQFHLESSKDSIEKLIKACRDEIVPDKYIQSEAEILSKSGYLEEIEGYMETVLMNIEKRQV